MRPRLGFLGAGWIGRHRLDAIAKSGLATIAAVADPSADALTDVRTSFPDARCVHHVDDLLSLELDAVVIATPSALHAEQAVRCLRQGLAVFCQKPLARTTVETALIVQTARDADRLLGVDFSYRFTAGLQKLRDLARAGTLGTIYALDLVFHNAYGPDKPWFYDARLSGGGCAIDLGIHLVDLAIWLLDDRVAAVSSRLYAGGQPLLASDVPVSSDAAASSEADGPPDIGPSDASGSARATSGSAPAASGSAPATSAAPASSSTVEDYAVARLDLAGGASAQLACSWKLPAGRDCEIRVTAYGTRGGASFYNLEGSFYEFALDRYDGTRTIRLVSPPDDWGGRAAVDWVRRLSRSPRFDPSIETAVEVARAIDAIYGASGGAAQAARECCASAMYDSSSRARASAV